MGEHYKSPKLTPQGSSEDKIKVNKNMQQNKQTTPQTPRPQPVSRPDERGTIAVTGFLKISDPQTKQVFVEKRA
jgi:hypothetical protein